MYILQSFMADFFKCLNCVVKEMRSHSHHSFAEYSYHPLLCCMLISWQIMILHFVMKNFFFFNFKEGGGEDTTLCNSRIYQYLSYIHLIDNRFSLFFSAQALCLSLSICFTGCIKDHCAAVSPLLTLVKSIQSLCKDRYISYLHDRIITESRY